jgi:hypothetical protein
VVDDLGRTGWALHPTTLYPSLYDVLTKQNLVIMVLPNAL